MNTYKNPPIGCYLDHANYNVDELNRRIIGLAMSFGYALDIDAQATMQAYADRDDDAERSNGPDSDLGEQLNWLADEAIDWLNNQEHRTGLYWANDGDRNAFGLWVNDIENIKDEVGFVSVKSHADARRLDIETDPDDPAYPPADYRGEWLHVSDHGNCTLYIREDAPKSGAAWNAKLAEIQDEIAEERGKMQAEFDDLSEYEKKPLEFPRDVNVATITERIAASHYTDKEIWSIV